MTARLFLPNLCGMRKRSRRSEILSKAKGAVYWEGRSEVDDAPVAVIATGIVPKPPAYSNQKLGRDVIQMWVIRTDVAPGQAVEQRKDRSVCGDCKLRGTGRHDRACYVNVAMVDRIYDCYRGGGYARDLSREDWAFLLGSRMVRLGAYGDPAAVPPWAWQRVWSGARRWIGYTHLWRRADPIYRNALMASVDSPNERLRANLKGWRTFRTRLPSEPLMAQGEIACPASPESGKQTTCESCGLCDGVRSMDRRKDLAIIAHGWIPNVSAYQAIKSRLPVVG